MNDESLADRRARRLARVYEMLSKVDEAIVRVRERPGVFEQVCRVLVEEGQLRMAWVGEIDDDGSVVPVAHAGAEQGYFASIQISVLDVPEGRGPTGTAARELRHVVAADIAQDERMAPWREAALARGFRSSAAFPLKVEDRCVAVLTAYAPEPGFFDEDEVRLFDRMVADLSFAVEAIEREGQLRNSEERFRVAAESMLEAFTVISPVRDTRGEIVDFRYRYVNDAYCALAGVSREQLLGHCIGELYPRFPGSSRFEEYRRVMLTRESYRTEGVRGQASWAGAPFATRVIDIAIAPMGEDLAMAAHDVTERELAKHELELRAELLDLAHDAVIVRDPADSRVTFWNREAEAMYGYSRAEAIDSITHELLATDFPDSREAVDQTLAAHGRWDGELRHTRKDGRVIVVASRQALARSQDWRPSAIIELNADITEGRRAQRERQKMADELEEAQRIAQLGSWRWDPYTNTRAWSSGMYLLYGRDPQTGPMDTDESFTFVHPDDLERVQGAYARMRDGGDGFEIDYRLIGADGVTRAVHAIARRDPEQPGRYRGTLQDVTSERDAASALAQQTEMLATLIDGAPIGMAVTLLGGRFARVNRALCELLGYPEEQLLTMSFADVTHPDDREMSSEANRRAIAGEILGPVQKRYLHRNGRVIWAIASAALIRTETGAPSYIIAQIQDITARRQTEEALRETQAQLRAIFDNAPVPLTFRDREGRYVQANRMAADTLGLTPEQLGGTRPTDHLDPQTRQWADELDEQIAGSRRPRTSEVSLRYADGTTHDLEVVGYPVLDDQGELVGIGAFSFDVTSRNRSERALRQASHDLEVAQRIAELGSFSTDSRLEEITWSAELFRIFGRDPAHGPPRAAELHAYIHPDDAAPARAAFAAAVAGEQPTELDVRVRAGDGDERILQVIVHPDPDRPGFCAGTAQDVTRTRATERALREQSERAESASRAKSDFLARMSHELRTPLNSIIGFSQLLELEGLEPRQSENVSYVLKAGQHLLELINEVLELTKIESGQVTISPEPVLLAEAVADALALVAPLAAQHDVTLGIDTNGLADDGHVHADRQRLQQVLLNVLSNAIKYNNPGGTVHVSFALTEDGRVRTTITDTGIGIAAEQLPNAFEPFERLGAEITQIEGTGLGLALSKGLVEAMGGTIEVDSQLGAGTTVTIELVGAQRPTGTQPPDTDDHEPDLGGRNGTRQAILYVEDNLSNLTLVKRILERYPHLDLIPAMQATIGLELARQHHPDLIILDLHLPDMPGTELLKRLKACQSTREIPIVVLTADASHRQSELTQRLGAVAYLTKPLDISRFLEIINDHLDGSK